MESNTKLYEKITTDSLMFDLEPGKASRTKFAVSLANDISRLEVDLLSPEQQEEVTKIKAKVFGFLV